MTDIVWFETIEGKKIFTVFSQSSSRTKNLVIMCHGFKGNSTGASRTFVSFSKILQENGISVLRFDQPNSGNSEGDFIDSSFLMWVRTVEYFVKKYVNQGYTVALLGHSMGATASLVATSSKDLKDTVRTVLLWAPDPKTEQTEWFIAETSTYSDTDEILEESGQRYKASFWQEVKDADFFRCLKEFPGKVHLVYGESDRFVSNNLREKVMRSVENMGQEVMVLEGQDHIGWDFNSCQEVYTRELRILKEQFAK